MKYYNLMIRYSYGHYDVCDEYGDFMESCDTYEEAQEAVDQYFKENAA